MREHPNFDKKIEQFRRKLGLIHGHIETRKLWQTAELEATRDFGDRSETDRRLFTGSLSYGPERAVEAIRSHWQVENGLHGVLDVTFGEDKCRTRTENAAKNLAVLSVFALNLLKLKNDKNHCKSTTYVCLEQRIFIGYVKLEKLTKKLNASALIVRKLALAR